VTEILVQKRRQLVIGSNLGAQFCEIDLFLIGLNRKQTKKHDIKNINKTVLNTRQQL
jgi:hypothetical protein